jgi:hypothetical protein
MSWVPSNGQNARNAAGYGSKHLYTDCGDNVGKGQLPAGDDSNLQRPAVIGRTEDGRRILVRRMSPQER